MKYITVRKNNNNAINNINIKNNLKTKRSRLKNRAASMDNTISNLSTLANTHIFNGKIEDYLITKELGKGSYAVVKLAMHKITKEKYAIKIYTKESLLDPQKRNTVKNEVNILKQLNHINIMKLYEVIDSSKYLYLVLEYIKGVSLLDVIKMEKLHHIEQHRAIKLFLQILKGISYCQSKNINHRDIKLENILVIKDDIVKIIDFGFSVKGSKETYQKLFCGTPSYMPPEIVNKEKYIAQYSDIWSLGVLLYTMLYGRFPFKAKDDERLFELINKAEVKFPENIFVSENIKILIKKILNIEPKLRPSPEEIINEIVFDEQL
jgi:serine/threonine protein kinase